jgi:hypothetical protein
LIISYKQTQAHWLWSPATCHGERRDNCLMAWNQPDVFMFSFALRSTVAFYKKSYSLAKGHGFKQLSLLGPPETHVQLMAARSKVWWMNIKRSRKEWNVQLFTTMLSQCDPGSGERGPIRHEGHNRPTNDWVGCYS